MERRIRKVTAYVCTDCFLAFPSKEDAYTHWDEAHYEPEPQRPRGRPRKQDGS